MSRTSTVNEVHMPRYAGEACRGVLIEDEGGGLNLFLLLDDENAKPIFHFRYHGAVDDDGMTYEEMAAADWIALLVAGADPDMDGWENELDCKGESGFRGLLSRGKVLADTVFINECNPLGLTLRSSTSVSTSFVKAVTDGVSEYDEFTRVLLIEEDTGALAIILLDDDSRPLFGSVYTRNEETGSTAYIGRAAEDYVGLLDKRFDPARAGWERTGRYLSFIFNLLGDSPKCRVIADSDARDERNPFGVLADAGAKRPVIHNPIAGIQDDLGDAKFVDMSISMITMQRLDGDSFWNKAEKALLLALIACMRDYLLPDGYGAGAMMNSLATLSGAEHSSDADDFVGFHVNLLASGIITKEFSEVGECGVGRAGGAAIRAVIYGVPERDGL